MAGASGHECGPCSLSEAASPIRQRLRHPQLVLSLSIPHVATADLPHLSKICRTLYFAARSQLYRTVTLRSLESATCFFKAIRSSHDLAENVQNITAVDSAEPGGLGKYVRMVEIRTAGLDFDEQYALETTFMFIVPLLPRLSAFHWMVSSKPINESLWCQLRSNCPELYHVNLQSANGIMPRSELWSMSNLSELRIHSWTAAVDQAVSGPLNLPLSDEASYHSRNHPLTRCITVLNPHLKILELDISAPNVAFGPPDGAIADILQSGHWPLLQEFVLGLPCSARWICRTERGEGHRISRAHEARMGKLMVSFLCRHPTIESLRFTRGSTTSYLPPIALLPPEPPTNETQIACQASCSLSLPSIWAPTRNRRSRASSYTATRPPVFFAHRLLPDDALPNLKTFQSPSIEDLLITCRAGAGRPITCLVRVEGDLESDGMYDATWMPGDVYKRLDPTGIGRPPITISEFSTALRSIPTLESAILILRGIAFRRDEFEMLLSSLGPNVRDLTLDAEWIGENTYSNQTTDIVNVLGTHLSNIRMLNIDASFVPVGQEWSPRAFVMALYRRCTSLTCVQVLRVDLHGQYMGYKCQEPFKVTKEEYLCIRKRAGEVTIDNL